MKFIAMMMAMSVMAGCAASSQHFRGPDGSDWVSISCRRNQGNCYEEAGLTCPNGYQVQDQSGRQGAVAISSYNRYGGSTTVVPTYRGEMIVKCK